MAVCAEMLAQCPTCSIVRSSVPCSPQTPGKLYHLHLNLINNEIHRAWLTLPERVWRDVAGRLFMRPVTIYETGESELLFKKNGLNRYIDYSKLWLGLHG